MDVLNKLPFGISLQDPNRTVLFENKKMKEWFGLHTTKKCYDRWDYLGKEGICRDCPTHLTQLDNQDHFVIRETVDKYGDPLTVKISHFPITEITGNILKYVEVIEEVDNTNSDLLIHLDTEQWVDMIYFAVVQINGKLGESAYFSEPIPFLEDVEKEKYFLNLALFWRNILGDKQRWNKGLFGPLPLFDSLNYHCYTYVFRNHREHNMLLIMTPRLFIGFRENLENIESYLDSVLDNKELSSSFDKPNLSFNSIREDLLDILW